MSIKNKVISLSTVAVLTLSLMVNCFADVMPFTDITNIGAKDKIIALQDKGYVKGIGNGLFAPDKMITAAESIQLIVNTFKLNIDNIRFIKAPYATDYYVKADNDAWYASTLIIAAMNNIGLPKDLDPNQKWTREEFTYQLIKATEQYGNLPLIKLNPVIITDQDKLTVDYSGAIQRALVYGITKLDAEGKFNPKAEVSRAEAAEQIYNALEYIKAHPAPQKTVD
jgi:hypothetical protein